MKACPTGHEFAEAPPVEVPVLRGFLVIRYDASQPRPLPDALIHLTRIRDLRVFSTHTKADGTFLFSTLPSDEYRLVACAEGFVTLESTVTVKPGTPDRPVALETRLDW